MEAYLRFEPGLQVNLVPPDDLTTEHDFMDQSPQATYILNGTDLPFFHLSRGQSSCWHFYYLLPVLPRHLAEACWCRTRWTRILSTPMLSHI